MVDLLTSQPKNPGELTDQSQSLILPLLTLFRILDSPAQGRFIKSETHSYFAFYITVNQEPF